MRRFLDHQQQYTRLPWLVIGMAVLTVTTVALGLHYVESRMVAARGESLAFAASEIADKLDLLLAEQYDDTLELARTQVFRKGGIAAQSAFLATVKVSHPVYLWLGLTDVGGRIVAATDRVSIGQDRSKSAWFQAARDGDEVHTMSVAEPFEETGGVNAISFTAPIKGVDGKFLGVLTTRVGLPALEEVLTRSIQTFRRREEFAGSIEYQFMDDKGTAFIDSDLLHKGNVNLKQLSVHSALVSESGEPGYVGELHKRRDVPVITGYAQTKGFDKSHNLKWTILLRMDQSDLLTPIRKVLWTLGAVSLLIGGPLFITLVWSTTRLKKEWALAQGEHARAALAEANYSALLESTGEGVCSMDGDGRLVFINSAGSIKLGYRPDELLGKRVHDILHHSHPDGSPYPFDQCPVTRTIRTGRSCVLENDVLWRKDGTSFPAKYSAYPIQEEGGIKGAVVIFNDVTEKEIAQENLRKSERFLHQAQQIARLGSWHWNISSNVVQWSQHLYQLFGLSPDTAVTFEVFLSLVHPEEQASVQSAVELSLLRDAPYDMEFRAVRPDGTIWWVHARGEVVRDSTGIPLVMVGIAQDITERKRTEDALRASEQRMRAILDGALDAVIGMDGRGVITDWNPRAETIFGWSRNEAIGQNLAETIVPPRYRERHHHGMRNFLATGEGPLLNRRIEITALRRDGTEFPVELTVTALKDETGHRFTAFLADITERKIAEGNLRDNEMQMRLFMEATADSIWNWDLVTNHLARSSGFEKLFGYAAEEIAPTIEWWVERLHPDDRERVWTAYQDTVTSGRTACSYEYRFRRRDGSYAVVIDRCYMVRDGIGKVVRAIGAMTDITARKQAEEKLLLSHEIITNAHDPISIMDLQGRFTYQNPAHASLVGFSDDELLGRTPALFLGEEMFASICQELTRTQSYRGEVVARTKDGMPKDLELSVFTIRDTADRPACFVAIKRDITERKQAEEKLRERSRQQAIEAELSLMAATVQDLSNLLGTAAKLVSNALEVDYCEVLELLPNRSELRLRSSSGWKSDCIGQVQAAETGSLAHAALQSSRPVVGTLPNDTRFGGPPWLRKHGAIGGMSVSIPGKESPWGVLGVYTAGRRTFSRDDVNFLQTVSSILAAAIERMQAESVLKNANQTLRLLSRQLLQVQEEDRRTIARDLHDEIGQSLTAIKLNVERAQRTSDAAARSRIMQDCVEITERVLGQVRDLSLDLHPSILDDLGLAYALKWYADRQATRAGLKVTVTADPSLPRLPQDIEIACFRIAQEALTNVVRHACASQAGITLKRGAAAVELCIQDDGIGFVVDKVAAPVNGEASIGLTSMQERAKLLGGSVKIASAPRRGTKVIATLPLLVVSPAGVPAEEVPRS